MPEAFNDLGANKTAGIQAKVYEYISRFKKVAFADIMLMHWREINQQDLQAVLNTLESMGAIKYQTINSVVYYYKPKVKEEEKNAKA